MDGAGRGSGICHLSEDASVCGGLTNFRGQYGSLPPGPEPGSSDIR